MTFNHGATMPKTNAERQRAYRARRKAERDASNGGSTIYRNGTNSNDASKGGRKRLPESYYLPNSDEMKCLGDWGYGPYWVRVINHRS